MQYVIHTHIFPCELRCVSGTYIMYSFRMYFYQVSDNGVISFNSTFNLSTPLSLPLSGTDKIIAPYWADVDTRGTGNIYYRQTTDPSLLARATSEIRAAFSTSQNFMAKHLLIITWNAVGYYYRNTDKVLATVPVCLVMYNPRMTY